ncbi:Arc family DNA-binding protein [Luteibacter yeojuensis]|uniref:Arc family DNA-binding protein n=1 Tax=Luteibacter yeojuensis TaxID=345309 RepID=A0A7X5QS41_9GAMM|nr:Arc family DNA-binding protein [Luteibacter yeojuensis]NID14380.1 Arc family DNA-binding protein [Luteibacter yeojuensis]
MKRTDPQFKIRLPEDLKDRLEALAAKEQRSVSAEIVARLQRTLDEDDARAGAPRPEDVAALLGDDEGVRGALEEMGTLARRMEAMTALLRSKASEQVLKDEKKAAKKRR